MAKFVFALLMILSAPNAAISEPSTVSRVEIVSNSVALPITTAPYDPWYKRFGTFVDDGRFYGYHAGDDIEIDVTTLLPGQEIPVHAIANATVAYVGWVRGYGGVMILTHNIDGNAVSSLYGHVDEASATVQVGDAVEAGQQIAVLGEHLSHETDGRRMHLHFAMWNGSEVKFPGYVDTEEELDGWLDPQDFLVEHGALPHLDTRRIFR